MLIPISGSSTCFIVLRTFSSVSGSFSAVSAVSATDSVILLSFRECQRFIERFPRQQRALDAHRISADSLQRLEVAQLDVVSRLTGQHAADGLNPAPCFRRAFAFHRL